MMTDPKGIAGAAKPQLQLIPPALNAEIAKALALGAAKYGPWNWRENKVEIMTYLGAMKRHIDAIIDGEDIDPESGAHHLGHIAAGCGIVLDAQRQGTLVDNRPGRLNVQAVPAAAGGSEPRAKSAAWHQRQVRHASTHTTAKPMSKEEEVEAHIADYDRLRQLCSEQFAALKWAKELLEQKGLANDSTEARP